MQGQIICFFLFMLSTSKVSQNQLRKEGERKREDIVKHFLIHPFSSTLLKKGEKISSDNVPTSW